MINLIGHEGKRARSLRRALFALLCVLGVSACAVQPERVAPVLVPGVNAQIWPLPPEQARYAYAGTLLGEENFVAKDGQSKKKKTLFAVIVGLVFGKPKYEELQRPMGGMVDAQGRVLVLDASRQAVMVFDMAAKRLLEWDRAAHGLGFDTPVAICADGTGGFWVTDSVLGEIFRLSADGKPLDRKGRGILVRPTGIARNNIDGRIYVADTGAHNIKVFDSSGKLIDTIGKRGTAAGQFNAPTYLAFKDGRLYVSDTLNFRIQVFDMNDDPVQSFGKLGVNVGNMSRPKGVAIGGDGRIYVVESYFDHVLIYDHKGRFLLSIGGTGKKVGQFFLPSGAWTDNSGRVYISDMFNGRVSVFKELTHGGSR